MNLKNPIAVTAVNAITAVGHDAVMTAASVHAGITRLIQSDDFMDIQGNPVTTAPIKGFDDDKPDKGQRLAEICGRCLGQMLASYFQDEVYSPDQIHLFLGAATSNRPGPRYEDRCLQGLVQVTQGFTERVAAEVIRQGNASAHLGAAQAVQLIETNPKALCIVGAVDSLLDRTTLNWFEQTRRLKSESHGRSQCLVPGEGAGFMILESDSHARQRNKTIFAHIFGLGTATEPAPLVSDEPTTGQGMTEACLSALKPVAAEEILTVLSDLNGERFRAKEWSLAEARCFETGKVKPTLICPAEYYGDIGAASGAVLTAIAGQGLNRDRHKAYLLLTCTDDYGACGAMVLGK